MAGNVSEWLLNTTGDGFLTGGGSWADPAYMFGRYGGFPASYSSDKLGFRCVHISPKATADQGGMPFSAEEVPTYTPTSEASFRAYLSHYRYDKTPLQARVEEIVETDEWRREKISYSGADDGRAMAYLYLPKNLAPPFQVIHFIPGVSAFRSLTVPQYVDMLLRPHIQSGRAVFVVVLDGYVERKWPPGRGLPDVSSVKYRQQMVNWATDIRRGLDYVETRKELEAAKIALFNISEERFLIVPAVESRYRSVVLVGIGLNESLLKVIPEANPIYFAPHIRAPTLMLHGRFDETDPLKSGAEPLYRLLRQPKRLELFNGGHVPSLEVSVPLVNGWLDTTLGLVQHN